MKTNTITEQHIGQLQDEAHAAGDRAMVRVCAIALGDVRATPRQVEEAWEDCRAAIASARDMVDA